MEKNTPGYNFGNELITPEKLQQLVDSALVDYSRMKGDPAAAGLAKSDLSNILAATLYERLGLIPASRLATATDADKIGLANLAAEVIAAVGRFFDPAGYKGEWNPVTNTPALPAPTYGSRTLGSGNAGLIVTGRISSPVRVAIVANGLQNQTLAVTVSNGWDISVRLATDAAAVLISTAAQVKTAIEASAEAAALITVAFPSGGDGSSLMAAAGLDYLSGSNVGWWYKASASGTSASPHAPGSYAAQDILLCNGTTFAKTTQAAAFPDLSNVVESAVLAKISQLPLTKMPAIPSSKLATSSDAEKIQVANLSDNIIAMMGAGLVPQLYQGPWDPATNTPAIPAPANDSRTTGSGASGLIWTSRYNGLSLVRVQIIAPAAASQSLSVSVATGDITVSLATDAGSVVTSTAVQVKTAVEANAAAAQLVTLALTGDGTGLMAAAALAALTGGNKDHWYKASAAGTATGNAAGSYVQGDITTSGGAGGTWKKVGATPVVIPDASIAGAKIAPDALDESKQVADLRTRNRRAAEQAASELYAQPNLLRSTWHDLEVGTVLNTVNSGWAATDSNYATVDLINGVRCMKHDRTGRGDGSVLYNHDITAGSITQMCASLWIESKTSGGTGARVILQQYAGASELTGLRAIYNISNGAIAEPTFVALSAAVDPTTTQVRLYMECKAGIITHYSHPLLAVGTNTRFRLPPAYLAAGVRPLLAGIARSQIDASFEADIVAAQNSTAALAADREMQELFNQPNLLKVWQQLPVGTVLQTGLGHGWLAISNAASVVQIGAVVGCRLDCSAGDRSMSSDNYAVPAAGASVCASVVIHSKTGGNSCRVILRQYTAGSVEIVAARAIYNIPNGVISAPLVATLIGTVDPTAVTMNLYLEGKSGFITEISAPLLAVGTNTRFRLPPAYIAGQIDPLLQSGGGGVVYISPAGNDANAGTLASPKLTLNSAIDAIKGTGVVNVQPGDYVWQSLDASKVKAVRVVGREQSNSGSANVRARFIGGTKLTGITNHTGKIYKATITLAGQPNWIFERDVNETATAISATLRHPLQQGRTHRMPHCRIRSVTNTSSLAAAVAEMLAAPDPRCYYETGTLYFSIQSGGDATAANIYVAGSQAFFTGTGGGHLEMVGLTWLFTGLDAASRFASGRWIDCTVHGSGTNAFYLEQQHEMFRCEATGGGASTGSTGDGFNVHNYGRTEFRHCWGHDNWDDGWSEHENCDSLYVGCVSEYNGGNGYIPAYGAHATFVACRSIANGQRAGHKWGGFAAIGAPVTTDDGVSTDALCINCVAANERTAFYDDGDSILRAVQCTAIAATTAAFDCDQIEDCRYTGTPPTVRRAAASVTSGVPVL